MDKTTRGFFFLRKLGYRRVLQWKNIPSRQGIKHLWYPIIHIIFFYTEVSSLYISAVTPCWRFFPSPVFFFSPQPVLSGTTWPGLISVSYGSRRVSPRPWTQTDWLASYLHSGLCVPFSSSAHCWAVKARPDREECGKGANMNLEHANTFANRHTSTERLYFKILPSTCCSLIKLSV